ncbi:MAG: hypothetical protein N2441_06575 [Rhodocyclaceae bacterium]|nr:hypothetical protein [Rhodocyclaceae bacterium]
MTKEKSAEGQALVRQLYAEAEQWARHYEALLVQTNVLIVPIVLGFVAYAFSSERAVHFERVAALIIAAFLAVVGFMLVRMLFRLYARTIERMIGFEKTLGCYDEDTGARLGHGGALLPQEMALLPVPEPPSVRFFKHIYGALAIFLPIALFYALAWMPEGCR